jgi:hypothetical protein
MRSHLSKEFPRIPSRERTLNYEHSQLALPISASLSQIVNSLDARLGENLNSNFYCSTRILTRKWSWLKNLVSRPQREKE